jgi:hypothetical protein
MVDDDDGDERRAAWLDRWAVRESEGHEFWRFLILCAMHPVQQHRALLVLARTFVKYSIHFLPISARLFLFSSSSHLYWFPVLGAQHSNVIRKGELILGDLNEA